MDMVNNRFAILLAEKQVKERRNISLQEVEKETGITRQALYKWKKNTLDRYEGRVINALCQYFSISPGELFEYIPDKKKK